MCHQSWTYLEAIIGSYVGRLRIIAVVRTYDFYPNSTNSHADHDHVERPWRQTLSLLPLVTEPRSPAPQAGTLPKELHYLDSLNANYSEPLQHFRLLVWQINAVKFSVGQFLRKANKCFGVCIVNQSMVAKTCRRLFHHLTLSL
jgi:hypothetical protein